MLVAVRVVGAVFPAPASAGEQEKGCALVRCGVFLSISLTERYIPRCFEIPMNLGFRWVPMWTASSVRTQKNPYNPSINGSSPFYRAIWDLAYRYGIKLASCTRNPAVSSYSSFIVFGLSNMTFVNGHIGT